jgi:hypothetical protein
MLAGLGVSAAACGGGGPPYSVHLNVGSRSHVSAQKSPLGAWVRSHANTIEQLSEYLRYDSTLVKSLSPSCALSENCDIELAESYCSYTATQEDLFGNIPLPPVATASEEWKTAGSDYALAHSQCGTAVASGLATAGAEADTQMLSTVAQANAAVISVFQSAGVNYKTVQKPHLKICLQSECVG